MDSKPTRVADIATEQTLAEQEKKLELELECLVRQERIHQVKAELAKVKDERKKNLRFDVSETQPMHSATDGVDHNLATPSSRGHSELAQHGVPCIWTGRGGSSYDPIRLESGGETPASVVGHGAPDLNATMLSWSSPLPDGLPRPGQHGDGTSSLGLALQVAEADDRQTRLLGGEAATDPTRTTASQVSAEERAQDPLAQQPVDSGDAAAHSMDRVLPEQPQPLNTTSSDIGRALQSENQDTEDQAQASRPATDQPATGAPAWTPRPDSTLKHHDFTPNKQFPTLIRLPKDQGHGWAELRCIICGGNYSPGKTGAPYWKGIQGVLSHVNVIHNGQLPRKKNTPQNILETCVVKALSYEDVEDMREGRKGAYKIPRIDPAAATENSFAKQPRERKTKQDSRVRNGCSNLTGKKASKRKNEDGTTSKAKRKSQDAVLPEAKMPRKHFWKVEEEDDDYTVGGTFQRQRNRGNEGKQPNTRPRRNNSRIVMDNNDDE